MMAGFIGRAQDWVRFSGRWKDTLASAPSVSRLKMNNAAKCKGEFNTFSKGARDKKVRQLVRVLDQYEFTAISCIVDTTGFEEHLAPIQPRPTKTLYTNTFYAIMRAACLEILDQGVRNERVEIFFDENSQCGTTAIRMYPAFRMGVTRRERLLLPTVPSFGNDDGLMPLQAADLLAWLLRRSASGLPHTFDWIVSEFSRVRPSAHNQIIDANRLRGIAERSFDFERNKKFMNRAMDAINHQDRG